jgi:hypothetical protein
MAQSRLIEAYLIELRHSVAGMAEADDIVDEVADHLYTALGRAGHAGVDEDEAASAVLARFGSAALVARVFSEERKRGGAVSTTLTRRAGLALMSSVFLLAGGQTGNHLTAGDRVEGLGVLHGAFLVMVAAGLAALALGLWGIRLRHGGMGTLGRVAFWWFVLSPVLAAPATWFAPIVLAIEWLAIITLLGVGMLRAGLLPRPAVALFTFGPTATLVVFAVLRRVSSSEIDPAPWGLLYFLAPLAVGFVWVGWTMAHEPALDARPAAGSGPLATA